MGSYMEMNESAAQWRRSKATISKTCREDKK